MTIKKLTIKQNSHSEHSKAIDQFIDKGGSSVSQRDEKQKDVTFTITIPEELCKIIDELRSVTKTSRRSWLLQAAQDKIQKEMVKDIK